MAVEEQKLPHKNAQSGWSTSLFPIAFHSTETGFAGGLGSVLTYRRPSADARLRPQSIPFIGFYTSKNQLLTAIAPQLYFDTMAWELNLRISYSNVPDELYGIGSKTTDLDREEFTLESAAFGVSLFRRIRADFRLGLFIDAEKTALVETEQGGLLERDLIAGRKGGWTSGGGVSFVWDSRDNIFYPSRGGWYTISTGHYGEALGSDYSFNTVRTDFRHYVRITDSHIAAIQMLALRRQGTVPFNQLPTLGEFMRGIRRGRFQDKALTMAQVEYRFPIAGRFSGALFSAFGNVSSSFRELRLLDGEMSGGLGIRFATNKTEKVNMRFDIGLSRWGVQPILRFQEAF